MQSGWWLLPGCYVEVMQICWLLGAEIPREAEILQNLWTSIKDHKMSSAEREMKESGFHWLNPQWKWKICRLIKTFLKIYFLSIPTYKKWSTVEETGWNWRKSLTFAPGRKVVFLFCFVSFWPMHYTTPRGAINRKYYVNSAHVVVWYNIPVLNS